MDMDITIAPHLGMKVSPRLVAANHILELSSLELQQAIAQELDENPALEKMEDVTCSVCGALLQGSICPHCLSQQKKDDPDAASSDSYDDEAAARSASASGEEDFDPLTQVADQMTLAEHLMIELQAILAAEQLPIAEYLVGNLDDRGWLACSIAEVADFFGVDEEEVEVVLAQIQTLDPVGIGARDLKECLLIQLQYLHDELGVDQPYAREIISDYLPLLGEHKFAKIATDLKIDSETVAEVWEFIKSQLNPYPARQFGGESAGGRSTYVLPDVIITERDRGFDVEVLESKRFFLRITPFYSQLSAEIESQPNRFTEEEKHHIQHYVSRAKLFIQNINQRRQTLHKITACLVARQGEFLTHGIRYLVPLTRAAVAAELGVHESTVSRATAAKFVMLPTKEVVAFSTFFSASLSVKDVIKEIIENEGNPLTDQEIAERLSVRGIRIARRTVAKYRDQLRILPSTLR
ncbi:MAG: RNA polymerase factor sigma-54 [Chloroflexi bacterium]|nr:RNA polymerase factor sigma-54 [Chloroflexota bacterium]